MNICLTDEAKENSRKQIVLDIKERLPVMLHSPCQLTCTYSVESRSDYYLLNMETRGVLELICQRCLQIYSYEHRHASQIAVCKDDHVAEELLHEFECILSKDNQVDLVEISTDDLHLFLPEKHEDIEDCDEHMKQYIELEK
jgi:uncharacterized protein